MLRFEGDIGRYIRWITVSFIVFFRVVAATAGVSAALVVIAVLFLTAFVAAITFIVIAVVSPLVLILAQVPKEGVLDVVLGEDVSINNLAQDFGRGLAYPLRINSLARNDVSPRLRQEDSARQFGCTRR